MDIFSWPPISWAFISFLANPSPLLLLPSCILFLTSGLYTSVWRDGCFSHLCKSEFVCLETINHDWQPCFVGCQILLTVSDSWSLASSSLARGRCMPAWQVCPLWASGETCCLPGLEFTDGLARGREVSRSLGSEASTLKRTTSHQFLCSFTQKLKAAFKQSVV